ncbi:MAG TPA: hypothetical protein ENJ28_07785 [Gammaproteobacteria bacterium]|nr:hypothetical protein [Gammaproteobacteria bacterium]
MKACIVVLMLFFCTFVPLMAEGSGSKHITDKKEKKWWEKREEIKPDIYYPHKIHMKIMKKNGDSCMLCHSFMSINITDPGLLKSITKIANEPLKEICHECHIVNVSAPSKCDVCHANLTSITPASHNYNYKLNHAEDSLFNPSECKTCHLDLSFCTDCHFRRDTGQRKVHVIGYLGSHGIDSRIDPAACARCHNAGYCSDCHGSLP